MQNTTTTKTYEISNATSGLILGTYEGEDESAAIRAMLEDAGCEDEPSGDLVASEVTWTVSHRSCGAWKTGIATESEAITEAELADRICQPGHIVFGEIAS